MHRDLDTGSSVVAHDEQLNRCVTSRLQPGVQQPGMLGGTRVKPVIKRGGWFDRCQELVRMVLNNQQEEAHEYARHHFVPNSSGT